MSKEEIKKIETRLNNLEARISPLKAENAKFEAEIKGLKFQQETFVKSFDQFMQEMIQRKGSDEYKGIVDAINELTQAVQTQPSPQVAMPTVSYDDLPWKQMSNKKGYWIWSDKSEGLANRIHESGGKLTEGGYDYGLYGDIHEALGIKKCVSRYTARKKT